MADLASVERVNYFLSHGITIGICYHWASFVLDVPRDEVVNSYLTWEIMPNRNGPNRPSNFVNWRKSAVMPLGVDNSNYSNL